MKRYHYEFTTTLDFTSPVMRHYVVLRCLPESTPAQRAVRCGVTTNPSFPLYCSKDGFGNRLLSGSYAPAHDHFAYRAAGIVENDCTQIPRSQAHPMYRHPGLLTKPDEALLDFAAAQNTADPEELAAAVHSHFQYTPGVTGAATTAAESFRLGKGVCQDYAQTLLALCRLKGLPARYCMGITEGEGVTHAWVEVHQNGQWLGLDPTRACRVDETYLRFAVGRDAQDCPVDRGTFQGVTGQTETVFASMQLE